MEPSPDPEAQHIPRSPRVWEPEGTYYISSLLGYEKGWPWGWCGVGQAWEGNFSGTYGTGCWGQGMRRCVAP